MQIEGHSTVPLLLHLSDEQPVELLLHNVAYAPTARCNLISLSFIAERAKLRGAWTKNNFHLHSI